MPTFATLWANHPTIKGDGPVLDRKVYENQCAISLSAALIRSGVDMHSYPGAKSWDKGKVKYALRAQELANWLSTPACKLPISREKMSAKEAFGGKTGINGRTGIVFLQNYWGPGAQGDHIDLWNGSRMTDWRSWARINVRIGDVGVHSLGWGSDPLKAQNVWFWGLA